jgi:hypothetical protein
LTEYLVTPQAAVDNSIIARYTVVVESGGFHLSGPETPHPLPKDLLLLTALLLFLVAVYQLFRKRWLLAQQQPDKRPRKPAVVRPKSEQDCLFCQADKTKKSALQREQPVAWSRCKGICDI